MMKSLVKFILTPPYLLLRKVSPQSAVHTKALLKKIFQGRKSKNLQVIEEKISELETKIAILEEQVERYASLSYLEIIKHVYDQNNVK